MNKSGEYFVIHSERGRMDNRCNKYEVYYLFGGSEEFNEHLKNCPDCREEIEKQRKLSYLLNFASKECKELQQNRHKINFIKAACFVLLVTVVGSYTGYNTYLTNKLNKNYSYAIISADDFNSTVLSKRGYPTDRYGFFDYD